MQSARPIVNKGGFFGVRAPLQARLAHRQGSRSLACLVKNESVLIVNTKGGGHAFLGLHLAKQLEQYGHRVTILNDGDEAKLSKKAPFNQYPTLRARVVYGDPTDPRTYPNDYFDVVYDNNGKDLAACKPLIDHFEGKVRNYVFVGSAGAYKANDVEPMHVEGDERKASAGHVAVERYLQARGLPFTVFQPLYIYGPHTAKDCEQWFMDRILRDRPVPIPTPGVQLTSLSHVEDLADMMARVPGRPSAVGQHFNLCSDRCISFEGIVKAIAAAAGKEAKIVHYDPKSVKLAKGEGFPFRAVHFFASSDKAKRVLGWKPAHDFKKDVAQLVKDYIDSGRLSKHVDFSADDQILAAAGVKVPTSSNASYSSGNGQGVTTQQEAKMFSKEQLEFLARKRASSASPQPAAAPAASSSAAAAGGKSVQYYISEGIITQQEASTYSPQQLEFLVRRRSGS